MEYEPTYTRRYEYRRLAKTHSARFQGSIEQDVHPITGTLLITFFIAMMVAPALLGLN